MNARVRMPSVLTSPKAVIVADDPVYARDLAAVLVAGGHQVVRLDGYDDGQFQAAELPDSLYLALPVADPLWAQCVDDLADAGFDGRLCLVTDLAAEAADALALSLRRRGLLADCVQIRDPSNWRGLSAGRGRLAAWLRRCLRPPGTRETQTAF